MYSFYPWAMETNNVLVTYYHFLLGCRWPKPLKTWFSPAIYVCTASWPTDYPLLERESEPWFLGRWNLHKITVMIAMNPYYLTAQLCDKMYIWSLFLTFKINLLVINAAILSFRDILGKSTEPDHTQTVRKGRRRTGWEDDGEVPEGLARVWRSLQFPR